MIEVIKETRPIARKEHRCDIWVFFQDWDREFPAGLNFAEKRIWVNSRNSCGIIRKGERYIRQVNKMDGYVYVFKSKEDITALFHKHDLFPDV